MQRRSVLYPASSSTSLDSWDFENLKYLRRISRSSRSTSAPSEPIATEGTSHKYSETMELTGQSLLSEEEGLQYHGPGKYAISDTLVAEKPEYKDLGLGWYSNFESYIRGKTVVTDGDDQLSSTTGPLDNCYLMDVVTIRNESVLASSIFNSKQFGSDGYETSSSRSSIEEQPIFHPDKAILDSGDSLSEDYTRGTSSVFSISEQHTNISRGFRNIQNTCPYCGDYSMESPMSSYIRANSVNYSFPMEKLEFTTDRFEDSVVSTLEDEHRLEMARSTSPYYVRLRRNLFLSNNSSPQLRPPKNFGIDQQGQLFIDYSSNWNGLEKYIQGIKSCN